MFKVNDRVTYGTAPGVGRIVFKDTGKEVADVWWDDYGFMTRCHYYQLRKVQETTTMDNPFIETVTTKRIKKGYYDGEWVGAADVFLETTPGGINLVIGADPNQMAACFFDKWTLGNLLKMLQEVHDLMED